MAHQVVLSTVGAYTGWHPYGCSEDDTVEDRGRLPAWAVARVMEDVLATHARMRTRAKRAFDEGRRAHRRPTRRERRRCDADFEVVIRHIMSYDKYLRPRMSPALLALKIRAPWNHTSISEYQFSLHTRFSRREFLSLFEADGLALIPDAIEISEGRHKWQVDRKLCTYILLRRFTQPATWREVAKDLGWTIGALCSIFTQV